jgi:hypothetical protein
MKKCIYIPEAGKPECPYCTIDDGVLPLHLQTFTKKAWLCWIDEAWARYTAICGKPSVEETT